jgi:hypothetical protein
MAGAYTITISAVDKATAAFDVVNKRVDALNKRLAAAQAPFKALGERFEKFTKLTGLDKIATGFGSVAARGTDAFKSMMRVVEPLAAITGVASIAGLYKLASGWAEIGRQLGQQATRANLSVNALQGLQGAARLAGIDAAALTGGMTTLNDNMRNAAFGGAPQFIQALQALGLNYDDIKKKTPEDALGIFADKIKAIKNPTDQAVAATALFGGAGEAMLPFLRDGAKGIAEYREEAVRLGRQLGQQGVDDANAFGRAQTRLEIATRGVANVLGDKLGVALTPVLNQFADWLGKSPQVTAALDAAGAAAKAFADWLRSVNWTGVATEIGTIAGHVNDVAQALGGWKAAGLDILRFMVVVWAAPIMFAIFKIGAALAKVPQQAVAAAAAANAQMAKINTGGGVATAAGGGMNLLKFAAGPLAIALGALSGDNSVAQPGDMSKQYPWLERLNQLINGTGDSPSFFNGGVGRLFSNSTTPGTGGDDGGTREIPPGEARKNAREMAAVFKQAGYTNEFSAGMLGSAMGESGDNPDPKHNNEGRGIFQDSPQRQAAIAEHMKKPFAQLTATEQAQGAVWEIANNPAFASLNTMAHTSHDAIGSSDAIVKTFEAPADIPGQQSARAPMTRGALHQIQLDDQNAPLPGQPAGDPVNMPPVGAAGAPGATGTVDMNVKVQGAAQVTTQATGNVNVETRNVAQSGY